MKITHVIHSIDRSKGGPSTYMQLLTGKLSDQIDIDVATLKSPDPIPLDQRIKYHTESASRLGLFGYAPGFKSYFEDCQTDLFHGNGLWQYPVHTMAATARKRRIPYILSTHGMLEPWSMTQGVLKKQLVMRLFQKKDLQQASVIHCTAHMEAEHVRNMGFKTPIAVIPNGIAVKAFEAKKDGKKDDKRKLLFLSRIHPKKGLDMLINAWSELDTGLRKDWIVQIAGNGEEAYIRELKDQVSRLKLADSIQFIGQVFDEERKAMYQQADLFVLPTHSENFGIVVAEALASGIPVITTKCAPWEDLEEYGCGWWTPIGVEYIRKALEEALSMSDHERAEMGLKGRKLVEEKYSIRKVADQMLELYRWVLGKSEKPEFVV